MQKYYYKEANMKDLAEKVYLEHNTHMKKYSMPELHSHEHLELYYLTEGNRQYFINDTLYFVNSGDVIIIPPDILHRTIGNEEGFFSRILLYFPETILEDEISEAYLKGTHDYFYKIPQKRKLIMRTFQIRF